MTYVVYCVEDEEIARDLENYLSKHGFKVEIEGSLVVIHEKEIKKELESFIKDTNKIEYEVLRSDPQTFVLAKMLRPEKLNLQRCEFCGRIASEQELFVHKKTHGIGF